MVEKNLDFAAEKPKIKLPRKIYKAKLIKMLIFFRACVFLLVLSAAIFAQTNDEQAVRGIVNNFYNIFQKKGGAGLKQFWKIDSPYLADFFKQTAKTFAENENISLQNLEFRNSTFKDEILRQRISVEILGKPQNLTFQFVKEVETWKIWRIRLSEEDVAFQIANSKTDNERDLLFTQNSNFQYSAIRDEIIKQGQILRNKGQAVSSKDVFLWLTKASENQSDEIGYSTALLNTALAYLDLGDMINASQTLHQGLPVCLESNNKLCLAKFYHNLGLVEAIQDNELLSETYYQKSLEISREIDDKLQLAKTLNNLGTMKYSFGKLDNALIYFQEVLKLYQALDNQRGVGIALGNISNQLESQGKYLEALDYQNRAYKIFVDIDEKVFTIISLYVIANLHLKLGNLEEAIKFADESTKLSRLLQIVSGGEFDELAVKGKALRLLKRFDEAKLALSEAIRRNETAKKSFVQEERNLQRFYKKRIAPYHEMVKLLVEMNLPQEALASAELVKARVLFDVITGGKSNLSKTMNIEERAKESQLKQDVSDSNRSLTNETQKEYQNKSRIAELENKLNQTRFALEEFQLRLYATKPELKLQRGEFTPIPFDQISALFPDEQTAFLEFTVTDEKTFLYVITKENEKLRLEIYPIDLKKDDLKKKTDEFRAIVSDSKLNLNYKEKGREIYGVLLASAREQLKGKRALVIIPDSFLWDIPFQALLSTENHFLIEDFAIFYAPSLTVLREMQKKSQSRLTKNPKLLAFGNPELNVSVISTLEKERGAKFENLPSAEKEVDSIAKLYGANQSTIYKNKLATEAIFKTNAGGFNILHFATHGILNNENPMYSALVLSSSAKSKEDGLLEAWELMDMNLNADLAVLSACESARGTSIGEGIVGLSWAFFVAGVPRIVASQWKVDSISTAELMVEFHRQMHILPNDSVAKSLQTAMRNQIKKPNRRHPFYWSGFIAIGKN